MKTCNSHTLLIVWGGPIWACCTLRGEGLHTRPKGLDHEIVRAHKKCLPTVPRHLQNHVGWSHALKCSVTGQSGEQFYNTKKDDHAAKVHHRTNCWMQHNKHMAYVLPHNKKKLCSYYKVLLSHAIFFCSFYCCGPSPQRPPWDTVVFNPLWPTTWWCLTLQRLASLCFPCRS